MEAVFVGLKMLGAHGAAKVEQGALPGANQRQGLVATKNTFRDQVSTLDILVTRQSTVNERLGQVAPVACV